MIENSDRANDIALVPGSIASHMSCLLVKLDQVELVTYRDIIRATLTRSDPKEFLFFNRDATGKSAAKAFIKRIQECTTDRDRPASIKALRTQLKAIQKYGRSARQTF